MISHISITSTISTILKQRKENTEESKDSNTELPPASSQNFSVGNDALNNFLNANTTILPETNKFEIDFSGVNKETRVKDLSDDDKFGKYLLVPTDEVDSGADKIFAELDKIKPQLLEYLKSRMKSLGIDTKWAEQILDKILTDAVKDAYKIDFSFEGAVKLSSSNKPELAENPTIEDLVNYCKSLIDYEYPANDDNNLMSLFQKGLKSSGIIEIGYAEDQYLLATADYFLTDEEKQLKEVMKILRDKNESETLVQDTQKLNDYIDTCEIHMLNVLKHRYPYESEEQLKTLIQTVRSSLYIAPNSNGEYVLDSILKEFENNCLVQAKKEFSHYK